MATDRARRRWLRAAAQSAAALAGLPVWAAARPTEVAPPAGLPTAPWPTLLAMWQEEPRGHVAGLWNAEHGGAGVALPGRGHQVVPCRSDPGQVLVVARRPGFWMARINLAAHRLDMLLEADAERSFEGHAAWSADGRRLYTTETDLLTGAGLVGVRDPTTLAKVDEWATHGIGPHALLVEPEGSLVVANGGVLTLPETGRMPRNAGRLDSSLVRLGGSDGSLHGQWRLAEPHLSLRHLARAADGAIGVALQVEGDDADARAPLFACLRGGLLAVGAVPADDGLGGYGADIAWLAGDPDLFAVSCTHGGRVGLWRADGAWHGGFALPRARALGIADGVLFAAGDEGDLARTDGQAPAAPARLASGVRWDNHFLPLPRAIT